MQLTVCSFQNCKFYLCIYLSLIADYRLLTADCQLPTVLWISSHTASNSKSIAMTNKEILQADMLDILFEHRNKLYGAYALRKTYTHRLSLALGVALSLVLLFVLI